MEVALWYSGIQCCWRWLHRAASFERRLQKNGGVVGGCESVLQVAIYFLLRVSPRNAAIGSHTTPIKWRSLPNAFSKVVQELCNESLQHCTERPQRHEFVTTFCRIVCSIVQTVSVTVCKSICDRGQTCASCTTVISHAFVVQKLWCQAFSLLHH